MAKFFCSAHDPKTNVGYTVAIDAMDHEQARQRGKLEMFPASADWPTRKHMNFYSSKM